MKQQTCVYLDKEIKDLAKAKNISISQVCNDALAAILMLPESKEAIEAERRKFKAYLEALNQKEEALIASKTLLKKQNSLGELRGDVKELSEAYFVKGTDLKHGMRWERLLGIFCKKWAVDKAMAMNYVEGKRRVG